MRLASDRGAVDGRALDEDDAVTVLSWIFGLEEDETGPLPMIVGWSVRARFNGVSSIIGSCVRPWGSIDRIKKEAFIYV